MCSGPQLYCQKFIRAQEWENIVFRFAIGKAKQGSDVFGGFSPHPVCLFIFTAAGWVQSLPLPSVLLLSRASLQCWQQQGKFPWRTELHLVHEACCGPKLPVPSLGSLKQLFPDLPGFKQEIVVPTCGHLQRRIKEAFTSHCSCNFLYFQVPCMLQLPAPSHTALTSWDKIPPICRAFSPLWEARLCSLSALVCVSIQTPL